MLHLDEIYLLYNKIENAGASATSAVKNKYFVHVHLRTWMVALKARQILKYHLQPHSKKM